MVNSNIEYNKLCDELENIILFYSGIRIVDLDKANLSFSTWRIVNKLLQKKLIVINNQVKTKINELFPINQIRNFISHSFQYNENDKKLQAEILIFLEEREKNFTKILQTYNSSTEIQEYLKIISLMMEMVSKNSGKLERLDLIILSFLLISFCLYKYEYKIVCFALKQKLIYNFIKNYKEIKEKNKGKNPEQWINLDLSKCKINNIFNLNQVQCKNIITMFQIADSIVNNQLLKLTEFDSIYENYISLINIKNKLKNNERIFELANLSIKELYYLFKYLFEFNDVSVEYISNKKDVNFKEDIIYFVKNNPNMLSLKFFIKKQNENLKNQFKKLFESLIYEEIVKEKFKFKDRSFEQFTFTFSKKIFISFLYDNLIKEDNNLNKKPFNIFQFLQNEAVTFKFNAIALIKTNLINSNKFLNDKHRNNLNNKVLEDRDYYKFLRQLSIVSLRYFISKYESKLNNDYVIIKNDKKKIDRKKIYDYYYYNFYLKVPKFDKNIDNKKDILDIILKLIFNIFNKLSYKETVEIKSIKSLNQLYDIAVRDIQERRKITSKLSYVKYRSYLSSFFHYFQKKSEVFDENKIKETFINFIEKSNLKKLKDNMKLEQTSISFKLKNKWLKINDINIEKINRYNILNFINCFNSYDIKYNYNIDYSVLHSNAIYVIADLPVPNLTNEKKLEPIFKFSEINNILFKLKKLENNNNFSKEEEKDFRHKLLHEHLIDNLDIYHKILI